MTREQSIPVNRYVLYVDNAYANEENKVYLDNTEPDQFFISVDAKNKQFMYSANITDAIVFNTDLEAKMVNKTFFDGNCIVMLVVGRS